MYKNLSPKALGITGRQSEIIELALTYGFRGMELDLADFIKRVEYSDLERASRFIRSAQINIGGFELPVRWRGDAALYAVDLEQLDQYVGYAASVGATSCHTIVMPGSDSLPYHENFEQHRERLGEIAGRLAKHEVRLGIGFLAAPEHHQEQQYQFIREAEALVTLIKSVGAENVGLQLDTWNWHFGGGTLDALSALGASAIVGVDLADASADADAEKISDEQRLLPSSEQGAVPNLDVLKQLIESEYEGPVTLAPHPKCFSGKTRDAIVQHSGNVMDNVWKALGLSRSGRLVSSASAESAKSAS